MFTGARVKNAGTSFFYHFERTLARYLRCGLFVQVYKECVLCDYACIITVWGCAEMLTFSFLNGSIPDSLHTSFTVKAHLQMSLVLKCRAT